VWEGEGGGEGACHDGGTPRVLMRAVKCSLSFALPAATPMSVPASPWATTRPAPPEYTLPKYLLAESKSPAWFANALSAKRGGGEGRKRKGERGLK
jgi:hypothetical protein